MCFRKSICTCRQERCTCWIS